MVESAWKQLSVALIVALTGADALAADVVAQRPAGDAVMVGASLVVMTPDFRAVVGLRANGQRRWRTALPNPPVGTQQLFAMAPDRVAVASGTWLYVMDAADGEILASHHPGSFAGVGRQGCWLDQRDGASAISCPCSFTLLHPKTGAALGPEHRVSPVETWEPEGGRWSGCMGETGTLVAAVGDVVIASVPRAKSGAGLVTSHDLAAWSVATGKELWRRASLGDLHAAPALSGGSATAGACWVGSRDGALVVFDCQTGIQRWKAKLQVSKGSDPQVEAAGDSLIARDGDLIVRRRADTGVVVWSIHAPGERVLLPSARAAVATGQASRARVINPDDGATVAMIALPKGRSRTIGPAPEGRGWLAKSDRSVVRFDERGKRVAAFKDKPINALDVGGGAVALRLLERVVLADADRLFGLAELKGPLRVVGLEGALGRGIVALFRSGDNAWDPADPDSFGEVQLVRFRR